MKKIGILALILSIQVWAHNQNPATIKKTVAKAFEALGADTPRQLLKGEKTLKIGGLVTQVFEAKDGKGVAVGRVLSLEFQERYYSLALNSQGELLQVVEDGSKLESDAWKNYEFVSRIQEWAGKK